MDQQEVQESDFSKRTIMVLVVLTVIISLAGTALVSYEVVHVKVAERPAMDQAKVTLTINPLPPKATGEVTLEILAP
ncbi:MAG: hypothetical protein V1725_01990 [archaeon]